MIGVVLVLSAALAGPMSPPEDGALAGPPAEMEWSDWSSVRLENGDLAALTSYDNGIVIAVRCSGGTFSTMISGLPPASDSRRVLRMSFGDEPANESSWFVGEAGTIVFSEFPSVAARRYRRGGVVRIGVPGGAEGGATLTYQVELPASPGAVDAVLDACGLPLVDPQDALLLSSDERGLPVGLDWRVRPRVHHPTGPTYERGFAGVVCVTQSDGSLEECRVDTEMPAGRGFGEASLRGLKHARIRSLDDAPVGGRRIGIPFNFLTMDTSAQSVTKNMARGRQSR